MASSSGQKLEAGLLHSGPFAKPPGMCPYYRSNPVDNTLPSCTCNYSPKLASNKEFHNSQQCPRGVDFITDYQYQITSGTLDLSLTYI